MNLVRWYNQNRQKFWGAIVIIAFAFILLQTLNRISCNNTNNNKNNEVQNNITANSKAISDKSGVTGGTVKEEDINGFQNVMDKFFEYCNKKDLNNAYNMLTDECKEVLYNDVNSFANNYYNNVFGNKQLVYKFENWNNNTYFVTLSEDPLGTGKLASEENEKKDYITIVGDKLNISSYVGRKEINNVQTIKNIEFNIKKKDIFMDYEEYDISIKNNTKDDISVGLPDETMSIYLKDSNDVRYGYYNHEFVSDNFVIKSQYTIDYKIKFYSSYVSTKKIESIMFSDIRTKYRGNNSFGENFRIELEL